MEEEGCCCLGCAGSGCVAAGGRLVFTGTGNGVLVRRDYDESAQLGQTQMDNCVKISMRTTVHKNICDMRVRASERATSADENRNRVEMESETGDIRLEECVKLASNRPAGVN